MKDKYKIGVYGKWKFSVKKLMFGRFLITQFKTYGHIIKVDETAIEIETCDLDINDKIITHRITWPRLIKFEKRDKPVETEKQ